MLVLVRRRTYDEGQTNHWLSHKQQQGSVLIDSMGCDAVVTVSFARASCLPWGQFSRLLELIPHRLTVDPGGSIPHRPSQVTVSWHKNLSKQWGVHV